MPTINKPKKHKVLRHPLTYTKFYNGLWIKLRKAYFMQHPLCEMCLRKGITRPALEIHHIRPISTGKDDLEKQALTLDPNNLMSLCIECHHKIHNQMRK